MVFSGVHAVWRRFYTDLQGHSEVVCYSAIDLAGTKAWALEVFESWGSKQCPGPWRARGARACNGGLGAEPPAGSRGRAPGGGSGGEAPLKLKAFWFLNVPRSGKTLRCLSRFDSSLTSQCRRLKLLGEQELWSALPCQKLGEQLLPQLLDLLAEPPSPSPSPAKTDLSPDSSTTSLRCRPLYI